MILYFCSEGGTEADSNFFKTTSDFMTEARFELETSLLVQFATALY